MKNISIVDILKLPVQERIRLVELIWDSVAAIPEDVEISPELKAELGACRIGKSAREVLRKNFNCVSLKLFQYI